jgi:nitroimidazol reductase NimA-like FMN-containing flavoprotein (pyridoxamine 5'-phosphate oxidase superfamily)
MNDPDEPLLDRFDTKISNTPSDPRVRDRIRALLDEQPFAVLCTQGEGQPYGSVIAYAASEDLLAVSFATPVATRKYRLLSECDRVALVVDTRSKFPDDLTQVEAITATGRAVELPAGPEHNHWLALLTARHPQMRSFFNAPSSALFRIDIVRYLHVTRFQEVHQWIPQSGG